MRVRALLLAGALVLYACSTGPRPPLSTTGPRALRSYVLVIPVGDALGSTLAKLLRDRGFRVWPGVRGGRGPAAARGPVPLRAAGPGDGRRVYSPFVSTRAGGIAVAASVTAGT